MPWRLDTMITENEKELKRIISELEQLRKDIYDYGYDESALWYIDNAIQSLKNI
jgi:hypothetical protein